MSVDSLRNEAREKNSTVNEMHDLLSRIPYNYDSIQEFADDDRNEDHDGVWYSDGQPMTGYAIKFAGRELFRVVSHLDQYATNAPLEPEIEDLLVRYGIPFAPTPSLATQKELWLRFIGAGDELIRKINS